MLLYAGITSSYSAVVLNTQILMIIVTKLKQWSLSAGNPLFFASKAGTSETLRNEIVFKTENIHCISLHNSRHLRPLSDNQFGHYLAGLIESSGNFENNNLEIIFNIKDTFLAYFIKKQLGYGSVKKLTPLNLVKYVLTHPDGLIKLLNLVNGKFLTNKIINQLLKYNLDNKFNIAILPPSSFDLKKNYWRDLNLNPYIPFFGVRS